MGVFDDIVAGVESATGLSPASGLALVAAVALLLCGLCTCCAALLCRRGCRRCRRRRHKTNDSADVSSKKKGRRSRRRGDGSKRKGEAGKGTLVAVAPWSSVFSTRMSLESSVADAAHADGTAVGAGGDGSPTVIRSRCNKSMRLSSYPSSPSDRLASPDSLQEAPAKRAAFAQRRLSVVSDASGEEGGTSVTPLAKEGKGVSLFTPNIEISSAAAKRWWARASRVPGRTLPAKPDSSPAPDNEFGSVIRSLSYSPESSHDKKATKVSLFTPQAPGLVARSPDTTASTAMWRAGDVARTVVQACERGFRFVTAPLHVSLAASP